MDGEKLLEVRCPGHIIDKSGNERICNKLCLKVYPGSSGEIQCRHCKSRFKFYIDNQATSSLAVRTNKIKG